MTAHLDYTKTSHALGQILRDLQLDEYATTDEFRIKRLHERLSKDAESLATATLPAAIFADPETAAFIIVQLSKHFAFIRAAAEYDGMLTQYYFQATIPSGTDNHRDFGRDNIKGAITALENNLSYIKSAWNTADYTTKRLIAPIILYNIFHSPSAKAMDLYISLFDESMLEDAKKFVATHDYSIYKGRTHISADLILTRFSQDHGFIRSLLPPNYNPYFAYTVFTGDNLHNMQTCWDAANAQEKAALMNVFSCRHGDIFAPALVAAHQNGNDKVLEWLWSLAGNVEQKKQMLGNIIKNSQRNPVVSLFFMLDSNDNKYHKTAIKLAMKEDQDFLALVENNNFELLKIAANIGNLKLINKYLDYRDSMFDQAAFDQIYKALENHKDSSNEMLQRFWRLNNPPNILQRVFGAGK